MTINEKILEILDGKKITQKELSEAIDVSPSTLNNWLNLGRSIPAEYINPIAHFLKVSLEQLLQEDIVHSVTEFTPKTEINSISNNNGAIINRVLMILKEKNLKMAELCRHLGISTSTIANWKTRQTDPPAKYIKSICEFLRIEYDVLLGNTSITGEESQDNADILEKELHCMIKQLPREKQLELRGYIKRMCEE